MDKKTIKFLIKSGFTVEEIAEMEENKETETTEEETKETKPEESKEKNAVDAILEDFKKEMKELRDSIHKANRENTYKKPEEKKEATFEEDVEKLIEEVTR